MNVLYRPDFERFDLYYALHVEQPQHFRVTYKEFKTQQVRVITHYPHAV